MIDVYTLSSEYVVLDRASLRLKTSQISTYVGYY